jgi:hypothetical protein
MGLPMWRIVLVIVVVFALFDHYMLDGRYATAVMQIFSSILHFSRL